MSVLKRIQLYDTTLRDGAQTAGIHFSSEDKVRISEELADFGMDWIEGGWPGASPTDQAFFESMKHRTWKHTKLVAFGSTARTGHPISEDQGLNNLISSDSDAVCIFGKSWDLHVTKGLDLTLEENLSLIQGSIAYLKKHIAIVIFDAEHFFDGFIANPKYAMQVLHAAILGGAEILVLCDTNGGSLPHQIEDTVQRIKQEFPNVTLGIHAHNDSEMAVANAIAAVRAGVSHVQGTINGIGERCGNTNLISFIPIACLKMKLDCGVNQQQLGQLTYLSSFVNEMANRLPWRHQPFVGQSAFAHKGGIHVSAIQKDRRLYEHLDPTCVGNSQRILISNQAGRSNIVAKLQQLEPTAIIQVNDPVVKEVIKNIKDMEAHGYAFEGADASFQLLLQRAMGRYQRHFELVGFRVFDEKRGHLKQPEAEASVQVRVHDRLLHRSALGEGPIHAMDQALRLALSGAYPCLESTRLSDFKVRVLSSKEATKAAVRVLIESTDGVKKWSTVGVSHDILEATYRALNDAIEYKLLIDQIPSDLERTQA